MPVIMALAEHRQTRRQLARALAAGGIGVHFVDRPAEVRQALRRSSPDLVIVDTDDVAPAAVEATIDLLLSNPRPVPMVLVSLGANKRPLLELLQRHRVDHLVAKHGALRAVFPILDERELLVTCQKLMRQDIFGIDKYLGQWAVDIHRLRVTSLTDKTAFVNEFEGFLTDLDCPSTIVPDILTASEELVMNAMVHAPRSSAGVPKYEELGILRPGFELDPGEHVQVSFGCDGQRLMLSVSDPFGALQRHTIYSYVAKGFMATKMAVEAKPSGAGLGLSMAFLSIHQLVFNVHEQLRTEVIAGWYLRVSTAAEFRQVGKSLNVFWIPRGEAPAPVPEPPARRPENARPASLREGNSLSGRIDEAVDLSGLTPGSQLDMRGVTAFTSRGMVAWLELTRTLSGPPIQLTGCPEPLIRAASEVDGVLKGIEVRTMLVPFACNTCHVDQRLELEPARAAVGAPHPCPACGGPLEHSGDPDELQAFLALLPERG